ncbi:MAG: (d)CMP kinase [Nitrospinota bacterium]
MAPVAGRAVSERRPIVAVDGPAGVGKSTAARGLAERLGFEYIDTGSLYRALAWRMLSRGDDPADPERALAHCREMRLEFRRVGGWGEVFVDGREVSGALRGEKAGEAASVVSAHPGVRKALLGLQRQLGARGGVVAEGRDIGTVVFPEAPLKFFLDAEPEVRVARRLAELGVGGEEKEALAEKLRARDLRDREREVAPLRPAHDAIRLDTSGMSVDEVIAFMLKEFELRFGAKG